MHLPTYIALMALAVIYGAINLFVSWWSNKFLFAVSLFVVLVTIWGALVQSLNEDSFEILWMRAYLIPSFLLCVAAILSHYEFANDALRMGGAPEIPLPVPGKSSDYEHAALGQIYAMLFPIFARFTAWVVAIRLDYKRSKQ